MIDAVKLTAPTRDSEQSWNGMHLEKNNKCKHANNMFMFIQECCLDIKLTSHLLLLYRVKPFELLVKLTCFSPIYIQRWSGNLGRPLWAKTDFYRDEQR